MADDDAREDSQPIDPIAVHAAFGAAEDSTEAREYLRKQSRLADLQIDTLEKKDEFELSHLRFRRFSDYARFALEIAGFLVVLLIVTGLGSMVWSAAQDRGLVVDAFSVPPDLAQTGLTGAVVANRLIDKYGQLQSASFSVIQGAESYRRDGSDDVRVEIPDTGVSLGELQHYLRDWLGHDTHVSGEVVRTAKGFSFTVRYGDQPGTTLEGSDLDTLLGQGAEHLLAAALPYRYAEFLARHNRAAEALALLPGLVSRGSAADRGRAYAAWAAVYFYQGEEREAERRALDGERVDPGNPVLRAYLGATESNLGHEENALRDDRDVLGRWDSEAVSGLDTLVAATLPQLFSNYEKEQEGDFAGAVAGWAYMVDAVLPAYDPGAHASDAAGDHDLDLAMRTADDIPATKNGKPDYTAPLTKMNVGYSSGDWDAALRSAAATDAILDKDDANRWQIAIFVLPVWAQAAAKSGDIAGAQTLIAKTPLDCDPCVRARGNIAVQKRDWAAAARWFALVSARSPHVPFADTDWGRMLMTKGDLDGAAAKFASASQKGPHFADPLELWGEVLIRKNRSDLALAKFEEAAKYAPNWGRLHLKWGEALAWTGRKDAAQAQFTAASRLFLTPSEQAELTRTKPAR